VLEVSQQDSRAVSTLPPWLTIAQEAEQCDVDRAEVYYRLLQKLEVRRIGIRGGATPWGRLIRVERGSVLEMCGQSAIPDDVLPRWVTPNPGRKLLPGQHAPHPPANRA
jgi:hypothetical protein